MRYDDLMITESPEMQLGFQMMANWLISDWVRRIIEFSRDRYTPVQWVYDLAAGSVAETFQHNRHLKKLPEKLRPFVKNAVAKHMRIAAREKDSERFGDYRATSQPEINLYFDMEVFARNLDEIRAGNASIIHNLLNTRRTTLIHELRHAYDDFASAGKYRETPQAATARQANTTALRNPSYANVHTAHNAYLLQPHEISAHFTHVVSAIAPYLHGSWRDYFSQFKANFDGWSQMPANVRMRLIKRLGAEWSQVHGRAPTDITPFIQKLAGKLRTAGSKISVYPAHGDIEIRDLATAKPREQAAVLHQVTYLADILKRQVVTYDDVPMLQGFGFVRNKGRNKDYRISAPFRYSPRSHMKRDKLGEADRLIPK
jgi:hypothetical protein